MKRCLVVALLAWAWVGQSYAQPGPTPLNSITAGEQAAQVGENQRQRAIAGQIGQQDYIRYRAGLADRRWLYADPPGLGGRFSPTQPTITGGLGPTLYGDGVFEPWAVWPGVIYGYRYDNPVEQPAGYEIQPTGPNSYTYGPAYDRRPPDYGPAPPPSYYPVAGPTTDPIMPRPAVGVAVPAELENAVAAFRVQQYEAVLDEMDRVDDTQPGLAAAGLLRAQALFALQRYEQAVAELRRTLPGLASQEWGKVVRNFRVIYPNGGLFQQELRALEGYLDDNPRDSQARLLLAYLYGYLGYPRQAVGELNQVEAFGPDRLTEQLKAEFASQIVAPEPEQQAGPRRF
ncbi:MAG: tetratricopeptide repeat protein [Pirellulales bacterium]